jgi:hypothetical protein
MKEYLIDYLQIKEIQFDTMFHHLHYLMLRNFGHIIHKF